MDVAQAVGEALEQAITYARTAERLRSAMESIRPAAQGLQDLQELDPDLGPEIAAAADHLMEAIEALSRAGTFLTARFDENQARLRASMGEQ